MKVNAHYIVDLIYSILKDDNNRCTLNIKYKIPDKMLNKIE